MKQIVIIGCGAAGLLLLYNFERQGIDPKRITMIDHSLNGGDLRNKWSKVKSNTTWRQITEAVPSEIAAVEPWSLLDPEQPCLLFHIIQYLMKVTERYRNQCGLRTGHVERVSYEEGKWRITVKKSEKNLVADILFCTQGSNCKTLDLPYPSIPLPVALDEISLRDYVGPKDHILLFGTAHSATLIAKNLLTLGATVTNFYASSKPFFFDRDGEYDGLKQEAATIADELLASKYPNYDLVSVQDVAAVIRSCKKVDACIYAIGFEAREPVSLKAYDTNTGRITDGPLAWGFGIAYPNRAADGVHFDVSVPAFQAHIQKQMPDILSSLTIE